MNMLKNFEDYEAYKVTDLVVQLPELMGMALLGGELIGFDGEFYDGMRGTDHNAILSGLEFNSWEELHNNIPFVRLVPESMTALISGLSVDTSILETIKDYGYTVEEY